MNCNSKCGTDSSRDLAQEIVQLKKEKNAVVLAHYYVDGAIQDIADYVGDSLALAQKAASACAQADIIVMCGDRKSVV